MLPGKEAKNDFQVSDNHPYSADSRFLKLKECTNKVQLWMSTSADLLSGY